MRKVLLRWKVSSLSGIDEIDKLMEICHRIEVLGHLSTDKEGVTQLVELGINSCLLYTSPSPRDKRQSRMPSSA